MAVKRGLGKGLDSLIPNSVDVKEPKQNPAKAEKPDTIVNINDIEPNRNQHKQKRVHQRNQEPGAGCDQ